MILIYILNSIDSDMFAKPLGHYCEALAIHQAQFKYPCFTFAVILIFEQTLDGPTGRSGFRHSYALSDSALRDLYRTIYQLTIGTHRGIR